MYQEKHSINLYETFTKYSIYKRLDYSSGPSNKIFFSLRNYNFSDSRQKICIMHHILCLFFFFWSEMFTLIDKLFLEIANNLYFKLQTQRKRILEIVQLYYYRCHQSILHAFSIFSWKYLKWGPAMRVCNEILSEVF